MLVVRIAVLLLLALHLRIGGSVSACTPVRVFDNSYAYGSKKALVCTRYIDRVSHYILVNLLIKNVKRRFEFSNADTSELQQFRPSTTPPQDT